MDEGDGSGVVVATGERGSIRVGTWNIWWRHGDLEAREPALISTLRSLDADVVGLQEVCSREPDQVAWLEAELGWEVVAAPGGDDDRFTIVNAIGSPWPILESEWRYLDVGDMPPHRTVLRARVETPAGPIDVYTTHLSHGFDQSALRCRQVAQVAEFVAERRPADADSLPPVVLGDLNAVPDSDEIRTLTGVSAPPVAGLVFTDAWARVGAGPGVTYSETNPHVVDSAWPERRLDYVLVGWPRPRPRGNPQRAQLFGAEPVQGVVGSDHFGVVVDLHS